MQVRADETPWWGIYGGLDGVATLTGNALFWPVVEKTFPFLNAEIRLLSSLDARKPEAAGPRKSRIVNIEKSSGTEQRWSKIWPGLARFGLDYAHQRGCQMVLKENGNLALASSTDPWFWLAELDRHGNSLWQKQYSLTSLRLAGMSRVPNDGYVMIFDGLTLMRVDETGNVRWLKQYNPVKAVADPQVEGFSDSAGPGMLVSGVIGTNAFAMRVDNGGGVVWANLYDPGAYARFLRTRATRDNGFLLAGDCDVPLMRGDGYWDRGKNGWVLKLDNGGNCQWATMCSAQTLYDVQETPDGGAIAVGQNGVDYLTPFSPPGAHKFSPSGAVQWQTSYDDANHEIGFDARSVAVTQGGYVIGGNSDMGDKTGAWLLRIRENGDVLWRSVWDGSSGLPDAIDGVLDGGDCFYVLGTTASEFSEFGKTATWLSAVPQTGQLWFESAPAITNQYTYPLVDDFAGKRWPFGIWNNAWAPVGVVAVTPTIITIIKDQSPVPAHDYWTTPKELAQAQFNPANDMPSLISAPRGTNFSIQWPVLGGEGFVPQTSTNLAGPWTKAPGIVIRANDLWLLQLPHTNSQQFFRLEK